MEDLVHISILLYLTITVMKIFITVSEVKCKRIEGNPITISESGEDIAYCDGDRVVVGKTTPYGVVLHELAHLRHCDAEVSSTLTVIVTGSIPATYWVGPISTLIGLLIFLLASMLMEVRADLYAVRKGGLIAARGLIKRFRELRARDGIIMDFPSTHLFH